MGLALCSPISRSISSNKPKREEGTGCTQCNPMQMMCM